VTTDRSVPRQCGTGGTIRQRHGCPRQSTSVLRLLDRADKDPEPQQKLTDAIITGIEPCQRDQPHPQLPPDSMARVTPATWAFHVRLFCCSSVLSSGDLLLGDGRFGVFSLHTVRIRGFRIAGLVGVLEPEFPWLNILSGPRPCPQPPQKQEPYGDRQQCHRTYQTHCVHPLSSCSAMPLGRLFRAEM